MRAKTLRRLPPAPDSGKRFCVSRESAYGVDPRRRVPEHASGYTVGRAEMNVAVVKQQLRVHVCLLGFHVSRSHPDEPVECPRAKTGVVGLYLAKQPQACTIAAFTQFPIRKAYPAQGVERRKFRFMPGFDSFLHSGRDKRAIRFFQWGQGLAIKIASLRAKSAFCNAVPQCAFHR